MFKFNLLQAQNTKATGILPPGMRNWLLPPWYRDQNNPLKINYATGQTAFYNFAHRSWTSLRSGPADELLLVDRFGIMYWEQLKISIEIWIYEQTELYTPGAYIHQTQRFVVEDGTLEVTLSLRSGDLSLKIGPIAVGGRQVTGIQINCPAFREFIPESGAGSAPRFFEPVIVWLVIRPFGPDGLTKINHLEYRNRYLLVNHKKLLRFEDEPQHCFFTNAALGDVTRYFRLWEGNSRIEAVDGSCTGMVGFAAIPADWRAVNIVIQPESAPRRLLIPNRMLKFLKPGAGADVQRIDSGPVIAGALHTGTRLDELFAASLRHLATFSREKPVNVNRILVLNRLGMAFQSHEYLQTALMKTRWDGSPAARYLCGESLGFAVADYYKMTADRALIEKYWPVLKQMGWWLCYQSGLFNTGSRTKPELPDDNGVRTERMLRLCASLQAITELGTALAKNSEVQIFKNHFLRLWTKLFNSLTAPGDNGVRSELGGNALGGESAVRKLIASFPLQLSEPGAFWIGDLLRRISARHLWRGGLVSPQDFQGINLELTARLGQAMIREGMEYQAVLDFLLEMAGPAFSWPDLIHPLTREGIGKRGHDPAVLYQVLLLVRSLFLIEESENLHLLPGIFISRFWRAPNLDLYDWPTYFGTVSLRVRTIGRIIQINFEPKFRRPPYKILLTFNRKYRLLYTDTNIQIHNKMLILNPDFKIVRLFSECLS